MIYHCQVDQDGCYTGIFKEAVDSDPIGSSWRVTYEKPPTLSQFHKYLWMPSFTWIPITIPPPSNEISKKQLIDYAREKRWKIENSGILVGNVLIPTDDRSKMLFYYTSLNIKKNELIPIIVNGEIIAEYSSSQFKNMMIAISSHIKNSFNLLGDAIEKINNNEINELFQIDDFFKEKRNG